MNNNHYLNSRRIFTDTDFVVNDSPQQLWTSTKWLVQKKKNLEKRVEEGLKKGDEKKGEKKDGEDKRNLPCGRHPKRHWPWARRWWSPIVGVGQGEGEMEMSERGSWQGLLGTEE